MAGNVTEAGLARMARESPLGAKVGVNGDRELNEWKARAEKAELAVRWLALKLGDCSFDEGDAPYCAFGDGGLCRVESVKQLIADGDWFPGESTDQCAACWETAALADAIIAQGVKP